MTQIGVLPRAPAPFLLVTSPWTWFAGRPPPPPRAFHSAEVSALLPGGLRFRGPFDSEPRASLFSVTVGAVLSSSSHIRVI